MSKSVPSIRGPERSGVRALFVAPALACGLLWGARSMAAPATDDLEPLRVEFVAPPSCPPSPTLYERVRAHTPRVRPAVDDEAARTLRVRIERRADGFIAQLELVEEGESLRRRVPGKSCNEVLDASALITALVIDPLAGTTPGAGTSTPSPAADAGADDASGADAASAPTEDASIGVTPATTDGGASTARSAVPGTVPLRGTDEPHRAPPSRVAVRPALGTSVAMLGLGRLVLGNVFWAEATLTSSSLRPSARLGVMQTQSFTEAADGRPAFFVLRTASLEGCVRAAGSDGGGPMKRAKHDDRRSTNETLQLRACLDFAGGTLESSSSAYGPVMRTTRPWFSLAGLLRGQWTFFGPLSLEASAGLGVPFVRDDFFFLPGIPVYRPPSLLVLGYVGVGTTFR